MVNVNLAARVIVFAGFLAILFFKNREIRKAIEAFKDHFLGGGPPSFSL